MARMLSRLARTATAMITVVGCLAPAGTSRAQGQIHASAPATKVVNPFSQTGAPRAADAPGAEKRLRRAAAAFRNPFASATALPPLAIPMRQGPISRWQRGPASVEQPSVVANAILSPLPEVAIGSPSASQLGNVNRDWDRLPPIESITEADVVRTTSIAVPVEAETARPPDPVAFAPSRLTQPVWMVPNLPGERPESTAEIVPFQLPPAADPFDLPAADTPTAENPAENSQPTAADRQQTQHTRPSPGRAPGAGLSLAIPAALEPTPVALPSSSFGEMLPIILSEYVNTADGWHADAERAALAAQTIDEISSVIRLCQQGLNGQPPMETAIALRRLAAWAHNRRGEMLVDQQRLQEALSEFEAAIGFDENSSLAIHNRAVTLAQQGRAADALRDFGRVIELNPGLAVAYRNRAELLASLGRIEEAISDYNRALEQLDDDAELYCARADAWQQLGRLDRAKNDLNEAVRLAPNYAEACTQRGNMCAALGDFDAAVRDLQRSLQLNPASAETRRSIAWLLATCPDPRFRDPQQAVEQARQGLALSAAPDAFLLDTLAAAQASAGDFASAAETVREAIKIAPADYAASMQARLAMYGRGKAYVEHADANVQRASHEEPAANSFRPRPGR